MTSTPTRKACARDPLFWIAGGGELYGSINGAEIDDQAITHAHAEYLRDKFLRGKVA